MNRDDNKKQMRDKIIIKISGKIVGVLSKWKISKKNYPKCFELKIKDFNTYVPGHTLVMTNKNKDKI